MLVESLKIFCDLVDTQSFSKTASLNGVTQSAISQQLKAIEQRQGKQLVEREKRKLNLTAEGEIFCQYAKEIVRLYEQMQNEIQALEGVVSGSVRLVSIYSFGMRELGRYVQAFLKAFPHVDLHLDYAHTQEVYDEVGSGAYDLGIVAYPKSQKNIEVIPFIQDLLVVICHPQHPLARQTAIEFKDLNNQPFVTFMQGVPTRQALDQFFRKHRTRPSIVMELDHIATVKNAVESNLGISIVPIHSVLEEGRAGSLAVRPLAEGELLRPLGIVKRKQRDLPNAAQKLIEVFTEWGIPRGDIRSRELLNPGT